MQFFQADQVLQHNNGLSDLDQGLDEFNDDNKNNQSSFGLQNLKFSEIARLFTKLSILRGKKKMDYLRYFLKLIFAKNRRPDFTYSVMRLLLPAEDRERGNYGVKEKNLAIIVRECFNLVKQQYERLKHFKNPNYHQSGVGIGDFAICLYDVVNGICNKVSTLMVKDLNDLLDQLVLCDSTAQQVKTFRKITNLANADQLKWISRIILKDLKLNIKMEAVLGSFHPDGNDYYNLTNSIKETCIKLQNLNISLNDEIALFHPIRPMLAGKKNIQYFINQAVQKQYLVETKFDGERLQAHIEGDKVKVFSRNGVEYNHVYEIMIPILKNNINCDACILDGEIIVLEKESKAMVPFGLNKVVALGQDSDMQLCYKIFDILWLKKDEEQINLMSHRLQDRKKLLKMAINEVPFILEVVKYQRINEQEGIKRAFKESMDRSEEGIMLKDPASPYVPKERALNWIKMKGDYIEGLTDTLDLIILGGYFGSYSYRVGPGGHWTDKITKFLLGVIDKIDPDNPKVAYAIPFCKVGNGYSGEQLQLIRNHLQRHFVLNDGITKPSFMSINWKPRIQDRPDCYINKLENSKIFEVKGAELMPSQAFGASVTLRFPRVVAFRTDKDWNQAMKLEDINNMQNDEKYTKNIRRKKAGSDDSGDERPPQDYETKKRYKIKKINQISNQFLCVNMGKEKLKSHLFIDMEFFVFQLETSEQTKHEVEKVILQHDGKVVQNPIVTTQFVVADRVDFKLILLQKNQKQSFTFIKPQYIFNCIKSQALIPFSPLYLTILPRDKRSYYIEHFDKFGDNYTSYLNQRQLNEILKEMENQKQCFPIDPRLQQTVSIKKRRDGVISLSFNLDELQIIKLKMEGNKFVTSFSEKPNSIIIGRNVPLNVINKIHQYANSSPQVNVQNYSILYNDSKE